MGTGTSSWPTALRRRPSGYIRTENTSNRLVCLRELNSQWQHETPEGDRSHPKLNYREIPDLYLKTSSIEKDIETSTYQMTMWHKKFAELLNIVVIVKTNLRTHKVAHVVLFSSDLDLPYDLVIDYYRLRFQIEFNFRDAKQYWGLEDFMVVNETPVYNSANLAMFMVNVSQALMRPMRSQWPQLSVNDLKTWFRSRKYVVETLKLLPEMPEPIFIDQTIAQVAQLGRIKALCHNLGRV